MHLRITDIAVRLIAFSALVSVTTISLEAQDSKKVQEPLYRVGQNQVRGTSLASSTTETPISPMDKALSIAENGLQHIRTDVRDYSAMLIKRERIDGIVGDPEFMDVKIRNRREAEGVPLSIYMKFLKPSKVKDREVIYVEGQNNGKLIAHEGTGMLKHITARLDPNGAMAMRGNRYPIYEAGIENLVFRLIEKGNRDKEIGDYEVKFYENTKINKRKCMLIQVTHPNKRPEFDFHICRVFIDTELNVPIRYAAYGWPEEEGGKPTLEEEYTYLNMNLNPGYTDADFDPENGKYSFK